MAVKNRSARFKAALKCKKAKERRRKCGYMGKRKAGGRLKSFRRA